jgi:hypothetical protein
MSMSISEAKVEETDSKATDTGRGGSDPVPAAGETAGAVKQPGEGRQSADKAVDAKPATGERGLGGMPGVVKGPRMPGKQAQ